MVTFLATYGWIIGVVVAVIAVIVFMASIYKVADIDKALIVTGGKEPVIKVSGGSFVIPIFRKADYFDLCMLTVRADKDEIKTLTAVPIIADWTAQIRPRVNDMDKLRTAIISFKERGKDGIIDDVRLTLMGAVRNVVASMTPEDILKDKDAFSQKVQVNVADEMDNMGLELVSLNIQDITDNNGYFDNIAAIDAADKRQAAEVKEAHVDRETRERKAEARKAAEVAEANAQKETELARMDAELIQSQKRKETDLQLAQFKIETDTANANAEVASELQRTSRLKEVEQKKGDVEVMKAEQQNLAAMKQREVMITKAESEKQKLEVEAQAAAQVQAIEAEAKVKVAEREANAARTVAQGDADVEKTKATARVNVAEQDAKAVKMNAEATAAKVKAEGQAEADVAKAKAMAEAEGYKAQQLAEAEGTKAKLLAEAEGIKAKKLAEAEGEKELAAARAANDQVNFQIESLKIQADAQVQIATATAQIMANIGEKAEFVNIGGGTIPGIAGAGSTGNVLVDTLSQIPMLMKTLNAQNQALNGRGVTEEVEDLSKAALSGLGALKGGETEPPAVEQKIEE